MLAHCHDLGYNGICRPVNTKDFCQVFEIVCAGFTDAKHRVAKPAHAQTTKLLVEEFHAQLAGEQRDVLDDGQTDAPVLVFGQLDNCRK